MIFKRIIGNGNLGSARYSRRGISSAGILFVGIARNVRRSIQRVLENVDAYGRLFNRHKVVIVENDSIDGTKEFLRTWARQKPYREHIEADEGSAHSISGHNTHRLAGVRNLYMKRIDAENEQLYHFVIIFDCDQVNVRAIDPESITAAIRFLCEEPTRAAVFANQRGFYYDIWALRHDIWCPNDCWQEFRAWSKVGFSSEAEWACVGARQVHISRTAGPIEVESAFGGFGIYRTIFLKGLRYRGSDRDETPTCEHISLHRQIRERGGRLFVFPSLRNSTQYEHIKRPHDLYYWSTRLREYLLGTVLAIAKL
jgi:hypothetical protein